MTHSMDEMLEMLQRYLIRELTRSFEAVDFFDRTNLIQMLKDIYAETDRAFVILIDEWDCLFREYQHDQVAQRKYLDFLRAWLKDQDYVALAYMTGILPIKKYGTHSALNMFTEYSMTDPGELAPFFGFTEQEVKRLCEKYEMNFEEARTWYDGYELLTHRQSGDVQYAMYSPKSVVEAMLRHKFSTYWNQTETYEALKAYIQMDMDGLKDAVVRMLAGEAVRINTGTFSNDMTTFATKGRCADAACSFGLPDVQQHGRNCHYPEQGSFAGVHQCNQHDGLERRDAVGTGLPQAVGIAVGT